MTPDDNAVIRQCWERVRQCWMQAELELTEDYRNHISLVQRTSGKGRSDHEARAEDTLRAIEYCRRRSAQ